MTDNEKRLLTTLADKPQSSRDRALRLLRIIDADLGAKVAEARQTGLDEHIRREAERQDDELLVAAFNSELVERSVMAVIGRMRHTESDQEIADYLLGMATALIEVGYRARSAEIEIARLGELSADEEQ